jgi:hypothetical protein
LTPCKNPMTAPLGWTNDGVDIVNMPISDSVSLSRRAVAHPFQPRVAP